MRRLLVWFMAVCIVPFVANAQSSFVLQVTAASAFLRAAPALDAPAVASVFENDSLVAIGRNVDGEWLQVARAGNLAKTGWINRKLVALTFEIAQLPLTDATTGVTGSAPVMDTGIAVLMIGEGTLRSAPGRNQPAVVVVPADLTLPVIERTPDAQWLKINFRGTVGWVVEFVTRTTADLNAVPISPEYAGDERFTALEIIPPEVQIAQIDRLLAFVQPVNETAAGVAAYWRMMARGETMACAAPPDVPYFVNSPRDLAELPELRRQERVLKRAVDDLNDAIEPMRRCGIYLPKEISSAYADAMSAQSILTALIQRMETLRRKIAG